MLTPSGTSTYTYTWTVPTGVATSTTKTVSTTKVGTYSLTITDANSCTSEIGTGTVTINPLPAKPTLTSPIICEGVTASVTMLTPTGTSTYTYTWTVPTGVATSTTKTVSTTKAGTYSLTITDANSCTSEIGTGTVTVNPLPAKPTLTSPIICEGVTASVTMLTPSGTSTYTYTWTVPTGVATSTTKTVSTTKAGTYSLTITDVNSCTSDIGTGIVTVNPLPAKPTLTSPIICEGETASVIMLTPSGTSTYTYTWTVPTGVATSTTNTVSTTKAGTYSLTITDDNSCTSEVGTGTVLVNALPTVTITNPSAVCAPGTIDLTATAITAGSTASLTYTYFTNATATNTLTNTSLVGTTGTYYIKGTSTLNCSAIKPVNTTINPVPSFSISSPSVCSGSPLTITANPLTGLSTDYNYTWLVPTGATIPGNISNFTTTISGVYTATIKNKTTNCESASLNNTVIFFPLPNAAAIVASDNKVMEGSTLNLTAAASGGTGAYIYTWIPNSTTNYSIIGGQNALFNALKEGVVNIKYQVKDANNCLTQSGDFMITIDPAVIIFELPNAFTPNGDGRNDELKVISNVGVKSLTSLKIFGRSGNLVFQSQDLSKGWDGRFNGNMLPIDVYYWTAVYVDRNNVSNSKNGTVLLLK
jgi:gliding motility-associated-like protein